MLWFERVKEVVETQQQLLHLKHDCGVKVAEICVAHTRTGHILASAYRSRFNIAYQNKTQFEFHTPHPSSQSHPHTFVESIHLQQRRIRVGIVELHRVISRDRLQGIIVVKQTKTKKKKRNNFLQMSRIDPGKCKLSKQKIVTSLTQSTNRRLKNVTSPIVAGLLVDAARRLVERNCGDDCSTLHANRLQHNADNIANKSS